MGRGSSKAGGGGAGGNQQMISGDVPFSAIVNASDNTITFNKVTTVSPKGYIPETGKKSDLGNLISKYNINDVVVNMYRDKSGANDLKRLQALGFKIQARYLGQAQAGSRIPPKDYYYMVRKTS